MSLLITSSFLKVNIIQYFFAQLTPINTKYFNVIEMYRYVLYRFSNTIINNLLLSIKYWLLVKLTNTLKYDNKVVCLNVPIKNYCNTIRVVSSFFFKNKLNNLLLFKLYVLSSFYFSYINIFTVYNSLINLPQIFTIIPFINLFYFKVRNY